ncbi:MAG: hypothetical protein KGI19_10835 [Thaumarchaeota archaeon]|nr:hypothetical protein [Nitrososphaerota archaeon]
MLLLNISESFQLVTIKDVDSPRVFTTKNGSMLMIISVEKSVKQLTTPSTVTFLKPEFFPPSELFDETNK